MLRELSIKNFAIIEDLTVGFVEGLTVLTGETGAGKSIIIDAVQLLAGGRGSQEFIRHGAKKPNLKDSLRFLLKTTLLIKNVQKLGLKLKREWLFYAVI